jgi:DNA-binding XRE family transcriptional regulator
MADEAPKQQPLPLKQLRQRVGLTQAEVARRIGVSDRAVRA